MRRAELTDAQWVLIQPLLAPQRPHSCRPALNHRLIVNAILWLTQPGGPWRDLPERYGFWKTAYSRFRCWNEQGIWEPFFAVLLAEAQCRGELNWNLHHIVSTIVRSHQHAAGAEKGGLRPRQQGPVRSYCKNCLNVRVRRSTGIGSDRIDSQRTEWLKGARAEGRGASRP